MVHNPVPRQLLVRNSQKVGLGQDKNETGLALSLTLSLGLLVLARTSQSFPGKIHEVYTRDVA